MSSVQPITPHVRALSAPAPLRELPAWCIWRFEKVEGIEKLQKIPYYAGGSKRYGKNGTPEDRAKLVTFDAAKEAAAKRGFDGVGFCPLPEFGIVALDFDNCFDANGEMPPEVAAIVTETYAEYSPSGQGIRVFMQGDLGNHKTNSKDHGWGFETFSSKGFVTVTGNTLITTEMGDLENVVAPLNEAALRLAAQRFKRDDRPLSGKDPFEYFAPIQGLKLEEAAEFLQDLDPSMPREPWRNVGMALHHEFESDDLAFDLWDSWSTGGYQYPGTEALRTQWASLDRREIEQAPITMATVRKMSTEARALKGLASRQSTVVDKIVEGAKAALEDAPKPVYYTTPDDYEGKFPIIDAASYSGRPAPPWIIKGVLPFADLAVMYGDSGSGKSFCAMDWGLSIAQGRQWRGLKVAQGRVLYLAAEGGGGVSQRLKAYAMHNSVDLATVPFGVMNAAPNFLNEEDVQQVIQALVAVGGADLIIVDTLAQVTAGGQENSSEDMGRAIKHARAIGEAAGAMVLLVHHSGKDASKGARGWSGLRAACDAEYEVLRYEDQENRLLRMTKSKDGRDDMAWGFRLEPIVLGCDEDLDDVISLVVTDAERPTPPPPKERGRSFSTARKLGQWEQHVMDGVAALDTGVTSMGIEAFIAFAAERIAVPLDGRDLRKQYVGRALKGLARLKDAPLLIENGSVFFCGQPVDSEMSQG